MSVLLNPFINNYLGGVAGTPGEPTPDPTSGYVPLDPLIGIGGVSMRPNQMVSPDVAEFYGGILNIAQPDASYFDEFPLPGVSGDGGSGTGLNVADPTEVVDTRIDYTDPAIYEPAIEILNQVLESGADPVAVNEAMNDVVSGGTSQMGTSQPPVMVPGLVATEPFIPEYDDTVLRDQMFELQNRLDQLEIPDFRQFDPSGLQAQIDALATAQPIDTSQFLTAADLPTFDTSQFLTAADLPRPQQFDPTFLQQQITELQNRPIPTTDRSQYLTAADLPTFDTSQFLTAADLPTFDTSEFLTAADLPTFEQFDPSNLQAQISALQSTPAIDTSQFLTAADLPTLDTSQFLTAADLPAAVDTSNFLTAADLPTIDTSQFLTAADLPNYDTSALEKEIADLRALINRNTVPTSTPGLTTPTFQGILPNFGGFNVR